MLETSVEQAVCTALLVVLWHRFLLPCRLLMLNTVSSALIWEGADLHGAW